MSRAWLEQWFDADQAAKGNVVRRARADVEKYSSINELLAYIKPHGFHLVEVGDQLIVICNPGQIRIVT